MRQVARLSLALMAMATMHLAAMADDLMPWQANLDAARQLAGRTNRLVLIHFYQVPCEPCVRVDREVFSKPETARALEANFVLVKLNAHEASGTAIMYGVTSTPSDVIINAAGQRLAVMPSPANAAQYVAGVNQTATNYRDSLLRAQGGQPQAPGAVNPLGAAPPMANNAMPGNPMPPMAAAPPQVPEVAVTIPKNTVPPTQSAYGDDRYAEYLRQHGGNASAPPAQAPANSAPPAVAGQAMFPPSSTAQPYAPQQAPPMAAGYPANPQQPPMMPAGAPPMTAPQVAQMPPGTPAVGLDGYCPVSLVERSQWVLGNKAFGAVHRGCTYLFASPVEQQKFLANPEIYSPVLSGNDPVLALDNQMSAPGKREFGVTHMNRVYLFANEQTRQRFEQNPQRYAAEALQARR